MKLGRYLINKGDFVVDVKKPEVYMRIVTFKPNGILIKDYYRCGEDLFPVTDKDSYFVSKEDLLKALESTSMNDKHYDTIR